MGAQVAAAVGDVDTFNGAATAQLSDAHTLTQLKAINNAISGQITLGDYSVALSGTSAEVAAALDGTFAAQYTGTATVSDAHTLAQLKTINNQTAGAITLHDKTVTLQGSVADVKAALSGINGYQGNVILNDANGTNITATDITEIEGNTSGTVTVSNNINLK